MRAKILFHSNVKEFILDAFDKSVRSDGVVIEKSSQQPVIAIDGQELSIEEFSGIKKGSEIYIKDDITSLIQLRHKLKNE